jgi:transposase
MALKLRTLTDDERSTIERLAHSRTAPARQVERAQIIWHLQQGLSVPAVATRLHLHEQTARDWLKRFNKDGLNGLDDLPRGGKPPTYTPEQRAEVIALTLTNPQELDLPFACWTLDRLVAYLSEHKQITLKRSRISEILIQEGLRWRQQETWFGERVDPDFAEKRGASKPSTPLPPTVAQSCASMSSAPKAPRFFPVTNPCGHKPLRRTCLPNEPSRKPIMGGAVMGMCSARSVHTPATRSPAVMIGVPLPTGSNFSVMSRRGCTPLWTT